MKHQLATPLIGVVVALALLPAAAAGGVNFSVKDLKSERSLLRLYDRWAKHYNLARNPAEKEKLRRLPAFNATAHRVAERAVAGQSPALNIFADLSDEEWHRRYMCSVRSLPPNLTAQHVKRRDDNGTLPIHVSFVWRNRTCGGQPCLGPVKIQGFCGCCWAFAATGALESRRAMSGNDMVLLSEQELLDCDTNSHRCAAGSAYSAFTYVMKNHGLSTSTSYPYRGVNDTCHASTGRRVDLNLRGITTVYRALDSLDEFNLLSAAAAGPVVVSIFVGNESKNNFREYHGGVYGPPRYECGHGKNNHEMLLVGYNPEYFILKNSWGRGWGEEGYLLLSRDLDCGIMNRTSYYPEID